MNNYSVNDILAIRDALGAEVFDQKYEIKTLNTINGQKPVVCARGTNTPVRIDSILPIEHQSHVEEDPMQTMLDRIEADTFRCGPWVDRSANDSNILASLEPEPVQLYGPFWYEGEVNCLFADSNNGKSVLAVQIAMELAGQGKRVAYFDCELSKVQFRQRLTAPGHPTIQLPATLRRIEYHPEQMSPEANLERDIVKSIEDLCLAQRYDTLIIDNLTTLCTKSQDAEYALKLMHELRKLKIAHRWNIMVIAHTPKRDKTLPITDDNLAGSKNIFNVFDSVFAMGRCLNGTDHRYLKQLKARACAIEYGADKVLEIELVKDETGFLHFETLGCTSEDALLSEPRENKNQERDQLILDLRDQGLSQKEIAKQLGVNVSTVCRTLKKHDNQSDLQSACNS